jgi:hypothetical protein
MIIHATTRVETHVNQTALDPQDPSWNTLALLYIHLRLDISLYFSFSLDSTLFSSCFLLSIMFLLPFLIMCGIRKKDS